MTYSLSMEVSDEHAGHIEQPYLTQRDRELLANDGDANMRWTDREGLPLDTTTVSVELTREVEDDETGEITEEQLILVRGTFYPADISVGLGPYVEVKSARRLVFDSPHFKEEGQVELDDWEVDTLVDLLKEQIRTECDRHF